MRNHFHATDVPGLLREVRAILAQGFRVYEGASYRVINNPLHRGTEDCDEPEFLIVSRSNSYTIGLTGRAGTEYEHQLNCDPAHLYWVETDTLPATPTPDLT